MPDRSAPTPAPRFELPTHDGGRWALDDHIGDARNGAKRARRPVVLVFHRHIH